MGRGRNLSYTGNLAPGPPGPQHTRGHNYTLSPPSLPGASPAPAGGLRRLPGQTRRPKKRPRRPKILPRGVQEGSKRAYERSKRPQDSSKPFQDGFRWSQDDPRGPGALPEAFMRLPKRAPKANFNCFSLMFEEFSGFHLFGARTAQNGSIGSTYRPKTAQEAPQKVNGGDDDESVPGASSEPSQKLRGIPTPFQCPP